MNDVQDRTRARLHELYEFPGIDEVTVTEPAPTSHLLPFLVGGLLPLAIVAASLIVHLQHLVK